MDKIVISLVIVSLLLGAGLLWTVEQLLQERERATKWEASHNALEIKVETRNRELARERRRRESANQQREALDQALRELERELASERQTLAEALASDEVARDWSDGRLPAVAAEWMRQRAAGHHREGGPGPGAGAPGPELPGAASSEQGRD